MIIITGNKKEVEEYIKSLTSSQVVMAIGLHPDEEYALAEKIQRNIL